MMRQTKRLDSGEFLTILAWSMLTRRWPRRNGRSPQEATGKTRAVMANPVDEAAIPMTLLNRIQGFMGGSRTCGSS